MNEEHRKAIQSSEAAQIHEEPEKAKQSPKEAQMHKEHRKRLRQRFLQEGLENFEPHVILELLLFYALPRKDTNELAHKVLNHFGSLSEVFDASFDQLMEVDGIGKESATLLSMVSQLSNVYMIDKVAKKSIKGLDQVAQFAYQCLIDKNTEHILVNQALIGELCLIDKNTEHILLICLDNNQSMITYKIISEGSVDQSLGDIREIARMMLSVNATAAVLAHNHPRGSTRPSAADERFTISVNEGLSKLHLKLLDHVIVNPGGYFSMASEPRKYGHCFL